MITVTLPWPSPKLSPNVHINWRKRAEVVKDARFAAKVDTLNVLNLWPIQYYRVPLPLRMSWTFHPPTGQIRPDKDNMIARCKALQDGIADAIGINDKNFDPTYRFGKPVEGGTIVVEIGVWTPTVQV